MLTAIGRNGPETLQSLDRAVRINEGRQALPAVTINAIMTGTGQAVPENATAVSLTTTGSYSGLVFAVDLSDDNVNWELGVRGYTATAASGATTFTPGTDVIKRYIFPTYGAAFYRIRSTAFTAGSCVFNALGLVKYTVPSDTTSTQGVSGSVSVIPLATSGYTRSRIVSAATTNSNLIITGAKKLYTIHAFNLAATDVFLKLYNKATAPTVGTDTPVMTFCLPGKAAGTNTVLFQLDLGTFGDAFSLGIGIGITGAIGDSDTTAITASSVIANIHYT